MRHAGSRSSGWLAVVALGAVLFVWPMAGAAQLTGLVDTPTTPLPDPGTATIDPIGAVLGTTTTLAATGALVGGTSNALQASEVVGDIPSMLTAEVLHAVTIGWPDQVASEASLAALELNVAGFNVGADFVMARALAVFGAAGVGITRIDNLSINGLPIAVTGDPNQTIAVPGGVVVINEQHVSADGTTVVNALHATISGVADVVVASATAGASGGEAKAVRASY
jgi:uncharacterized Zn-binding protein involved in type VI secretion